MEQPSLPFLSPGSSSDAQWVVVSAWQASPPGPGVFAHETDFRASACFGIFSSQETLLNGPRKGPGRIHSSLAGGGIWLLVLLQPGSHGGTLKPET